MLFRSPFNLRNGMANGNFNVKPTEIRVIPGDVGGSFGMKSGVHVEEVFVTWAARKLNRPVKWRGDRGETFVSDYHGRDQVNHAEMGFDKDGKIVAMKLATLVNVGAYLSENGVRLPMEGGGRIIPCVYHVPDFYFSVKPVFTHTICTDTYRGAGRPEANYIMERLMDAGAKATGLSRDEIRRRNYITQAQMPYKTPTEKVYDSGEFAEHMARAKEVGDWDGFRKRFAESKKAKKLRGIGLATYIEACGGMGPDRKSTRLNPVT